MQEPIPVPGHLIAQKRVLITGAGGSIGSALTHAIATHQPEQVLLLESSEQALYQIDRALAAPHQSILADVCNAVQLEEIFERYRPHLVFHAAAFKHVPLMERHPFAAVENNTLGTFALAQAAVNRNATQVILVSTDKAVNPASIMGASKRMAEIAALALQAKATTIKAVRLGNVYGSQGSVVPLFQEQIAQGKPLTITDPQATRYFISIDQATTLLLHALTEKLPGTVLVPALNHHVRIEEIAADLLRAAGANSGIVYTGLRPGEKLHEQLMAAEESFLDEAAAPIHAIRSKSISQAQALAWIGDLQAAVRERNLDQLLRAVNQFIPNYRPSKTLLTQIAEECRA